MNLGQDSSKENPIIPAITCAALGKLISQSLSALTPEQLRAAMATGDPAGEPARELARMHARWIALHWGEGRYSREAHRGLAQMYLADDRFRAYYDEAAGEGATEFLVAALESYLA